MPSHDCAYEHDGFQCPKLGIYTTSAHADAKARWWCAYYFAPQHRGHDYTDGRMVRAIAEEVREGRQGRGSALVARETDPLMHADLELLDLARRPGESKTDFVARCRAAMRVGPGSLLWRVSAEERRLLIEAGEDPDVL